MLKYRLIFGPLMIAALLAIIYGDQRLGRVPLPGQGWSHVFQLPQYLPPGLLTLLAFCVLIVLGTAELCRLVQAKGVAVRTPVVTAASLAACIVIYLTPMQFHVTGMVVLATVLILALLAALLRHSIDKRIEGAMAAGGATMLFVIYIGVMPAFYLMLMARGFSPWLIAAIMLVTKSCDIGAYFTGRALGRHKLIVWLSPGKTWEGLVGGLLLCAVIAFLLAGAYHQFRWPIVLVHDQFVYMPGLFTPWVCALAGMLLGALGHLGDLIISLFKRDAGTKDSGKSIPGFGGVLDVVDSPIAVAPLAYWLIVLAG